MSKLRAAKPGGFTTIREGDFKRRFVGELGPCVDRIRDIYTKLGTRTYTVKMVKTRWSAGQRGDGVEEMVEETIILPTPKITSFVDLDALITGVGVTEMGGVRLSQVSMSFTEDELAGRSLDGSPLPIDQNFYYEIEFFSNGARILRRFTVDGVPSLEPLKFHWTVKLKKADEDRSRNGTPRG